jgi:hypothetical protein
MSGYIVTNSFSCEKNVLQEQIRKYIGICRNDNKSNDSYRAYGGIELHVSVLPSVIFVTSTDAATQDCGWLLADAIGIDAEQVDLSFLMWQTTIKLRNSSSTADDMLSRSNILEQMQRNVTVCEKLLEIVNNRRFWKQAGYNNSSGSEMLTYILFTRYDFVVDASGDSNPRLKNSNNGQSGILERKNVIIFAIDLLRFFGLSAFDIELPYKVKLNNSKTPARYEVTR